MNYFKKASVFFVINLIFILSCAVGLSKEPLKVTKVDPPDGAMNFPFFESMTISFSADLNLATVNGDSIFLTDSSSNKVPCQLTKSEKRIILKMNALLSPVSRYTIHVTKAVQDADGNSLASEFTSVFTTGGL
jgi:hypothetical protein